MSNIPQLFMRHPDITVLPPLSLPAGISLHSHTEGMDDKWEELIEKAFGMKFSFKDFIVNGGGYKPEYVLYLSENGKPIATTTAIENEKYPGEGWFRMVGVDPESRGKGAGRLICLAALHSLAARGYKTALLSTDDERLPAINLYYSLGFRPVYSHESHMERWNKILSGGCKISAERL